MTEIVFCLFVIAATIGVFALPAWGWWLFSLRAGC